MRINLNQQDINDAIKAYLSSNGLMTTNQGFEIQFKAGRKGSGLSATVDVVPREDNFEGLPGNLGEAEDNAPNLQLVKAKAEPAGPLEEVVMTTPVVEPQTGEKQEPESEKVEAEAPKEEASSPSKKVSLFG